MFTAYDKAIVAALWAGVLIWQILSPDTAPAVGEADIAQWVEAITAVIGPVLVYLVPNKDFVRL